VRRQAGDGSIVGGGMEDRSGGRRRVMRQEMHCKTEDESESGRHIGRWRMSRKAKGAVQDRKAWHKGAPLIPCLYLPLPCKGYCGWTGCRVGCAVEHSTSRGSEGV